MIEALIVEDIPETTDPVEFPLVRKANDVSCSVVHFDGAVRAYFNKDGSFFGLGSGGNLKREDAEHYRNQCGVKCVRLVLTAEDGKEDVRIVRADSNNGRYWHAHWLRLGAGCYVLVDLSREWAKLLDTEDEEGESFKIGRVTDSVIGDPLPKGTKTTIEVRDGRIEAVSVENPSPAYPHELSNGAVLHRTPGGKYRLTRYNNTEPAFMHSDALREAADYIDANPNS